VPPGRGSPTRDTGEEEGEEISETGNLGWILETDTRYKISQSGVWLGVNKNR
jgi:hypothetical protein